MESYYSHFILLPSNTSLTATEAAERRAHTHSDVVFSRHDARIWKPACKNFVLSILSDKNYEWYIVSWVFSPPIFISQIWHFYFSMADCLTCAAFPRHPVLALPPWNPLFSYGAIKKFSLLYLWARIMRLLVSIQPLFPQCCVTEWDCSAVVLNLFLITTVYKQFGGPFISSPFAFHSVINLISWVQSVICQTAVCPAGYWINLNSLESSKFSAYAVNTRNLHKPNIHPQAKTWWERWAKLIPFGQGPWRRLWLLVGNRLSRSFSSKCFGLFMC